MALFEDVIARVLGSGEVEVTATEARMIRASSANSWYRTTERAPVYANFSGRVAWPPSLALLENQPKVRVGDVVTVVRVAEYCPEPSRQWGLQQTCMIGGHEVIQRDEFFWPSRFVPVAARDEEGTFVMGWMDPRQLVPSAPPAFVGAYHRSLTPGGTVEAAPAYSPMAPLPLPGTTRETMRPIAAPTLDPGGGIRAPYRPRESPAPLFRSGPVAMPAPMLPGSPPPGVTRPAGRPTVYVPPVRRPAPRAPEPPPVVVTPGEAEEGSGWTTGEKIVAGGVVALAALAAIAAFGKKSKAPTKTNNRRRNRRGLSDGWHWYRKTAAVLIRKGRPVKVAGTGSVSGATRGLETFVGQAVTLKNKIAPPRKLVGSAGWAYAVEAA